MSVIICLSGWRRSGKDTVGNYLECFNGFQKISFAKSLKDHTAELFDLDRTLFDSDEHKDMPLLDYPVEEKLDNSSEALIKTLNGEFKQIEGKGYFTPRTLCILVGSMGRTTKNDFWVQKSLKNLSANNNYIITDCRYKNELISVQKYVKFHEVIPIRINRFNSVDSNNSSERDLDDYPFKYYLENKGSILELYRNLDLLLKETKI